MKQIFRKASLERLSSPEQLDQLMQVTRPLGWFALLGCFILFGVAVFWGYRGEIPTKVYGQGILLRKGSIHNVVSLGSGPIEKLFVEVDQIVQKGQLLARLGQPDLEHKIKEAQDRLRNLEAEQKLISSLDAKTANLKRKYLIRQRRAIKEAIKFGEERLSFYKKQVAHEKRLLDKGISTPSQLQDAKNVYENTIQEIMKYKSELNNLSSQEVDLMSRKEKDQITIEHKISQARGNIKALQDNLHLQSRIISPHWGRVLEIFKDRGKVIGEGEPLLSIEVIEQGKESLSAVLYFPPLEGKKIHKGMKVHVTPSVVREEEYGHVLGRVNQVSGFPASRKGMLRMLQNEDLVRSLSEGGAPIFVSTTLIPDAGNVSGYKWASGQGPPLEIQSGTLCSGSVVVDKQRPLSLVLPLLKKHILGIGEEHVQAEK